MSGSGDSRSRKETAKWQDSQVAYVESGKAGTRLTFRFDVPDDLTEFDAGKKGGDYHLWRMNVQADLAGVDFDRDYEVPVYAIGEASHNLSAHNIQSAHGQQDRLDEFAVRRKIQRSYGSGGTELFYPAGRNRLSALTASTCWRQIASPAFVAFAETKAEDDEFCQ